MARIIAIIALIALTTGCDRSPIDQKSLGQASEQLNKTAKDAMNLFDGQTKELSEATQQEFDKLSQWEYRVEELDPGLSVADMQQRLSSLGIERWDCFHAEPAQSKLRLFCKRHPKTYLRYLPRMFPG